ncbi:MAG: aldehyde dehydrogenase [Gammaproteobacteria bacterium]|nr:MAG: aldehyde dehydrogenase [Gammaproteobacteria bacterium]
MKCFINGQWLSLAKQMDVVDPYDNQIIDTVPVATREDMTLAIDYAVDGAKAALNMATHQRCEILRNVAQSLSDERESFANIIAREGIKTIREARAEVGRCVETLRIAAEEARNLVGETINFDQMPGSENRIGHFVRTPLGIIAAITPFNDPLNLVAHKIGPAIAAGNAVILKPHTNTPLSALMLAKLFDNAGLPKAVLQVLTGAGREIGDTLITDKRVRMVSFTGGRATGEKIIARAGLKKIGMELGSNCAAVIMADADFDKAVDSTVSGAYWAAGQNCLHVQRILVEHSIYDKFKQAFIAKASCYQLGNKLNESTDMGCIIDEKAAQNIETLLKDSLTKGADLVMGGERTGTQFQPTLLENVPKDARLHQEEVFGPVSILYRFNNLDEALDIVNDVDFGLQNGIFTKDLATALEAAKRMECGGVLINDTGDYRIDAMPFGGVKGSGIGREGVKFAVEEMSEIKMICFNL